MFVLGALAAACNNGTPDTNTKQPVRIAKASGKPSPVLQAQMIYRTRCTMCHGQKGMGDGPSATALNPKPRNYSDIAWQRSVTDQEIRDTIVKGGVATGKSPTMPGQPDLVDKPEIVRELVKIIRGFAEK